MKGCNMKRKHITTAGIAVILLVCLSFIGSSVMAGARKYPKFSKILKEDLVSVDLSGQAFSVNVKDGFLVVNQTKVNLVEGATLASGESISTVILDENQNRIPLSQLKDYQRISVQAYRTEDGFTFARKIQKQLSLEKDKVGPSVVPE